MPGFSKLLVFNTELIFAMKIDRVISLAMVIMFELLFRTTAESSGDYVFRLGQRWRRRMPPTWDRGLQDTGYRSRRSCRHRCGIDTDDVKKYCPRYARIDFECAFLMFRTNLSFSPNQQSLSIKSSEAPFVKSLFTVTSSFNRKRQETRQTIWLVKKFKSVMFKAS